MSATVSAPSSQAGLSDVTPRQPHHGHRHRRHRPTRQPETEAEANTVVRQNTRGRGGQARPQGRGGIPVGPASSAPLPRPESTATVSGNSSVAPPEHVSRERRSRGGRAANLRRDLDGPGRSTNAAASRRQPAEGRIAAHGRQFGGQLTTDSNSTGSDGHGRQLNAGAAEFRPGQSHKHAPTAPKAPVEQQSIRRIGNKSAAPDIATRTHQDIDNGHYECPICTNEVLRNSKVWSCRTCWTVFHLSCVKKWASNEGSTQEQPQNGETYSGRQWRCPGCNLPKDALPKAYTCWCEKEQDPRPTPGIPPHSCGNTCGRERHLPKKCPHPCLLTCHAGPCPPCTHMGPTMNCFCGKNTATRRCVDTDYDNGWSCGQICGDLMPCGEHSCDRPCHEGLCGACEYPITARCYCGSEDRNIPCWERGDEKECKRLLDKGDNQEGPVVDEWIGMFQCGGICGRQFDCGRHRCEKTCHQQDANPPHCPRSPDMVTHCPCGKTSLQDISQTRRQSCEDPIPNCTQRCLRPLACGHPCPQVCHSGECMPCLRVVSVICRCGKTSASTICHQGREEPPQCMRMCRAILHCGRHNCDERCCPGERKTSERQSSRRKQRPLDSAPQPVDDGFAAEHICMRTCGRTLKCGNHTCQDLCHKGPCGSCREAIFDEVSCNCGRTVLQPPLPCGTLPPPCRYNCDRPKNCGHAQVPHNCHMDDESCPKCPYLTVKPCLCGRNLLKNQPCWLKEVRCGEPCGIKLRCGSHNCRKPCHAPGECEDNGKTAGCQQPCGKLRRTCGHPDEDSCHAPFPCKEEKPCAFKIFVTCECQHLKQEMRCSASKNSEGNAKKVLKCDDECARLERNRKLALALNIDPDTHKDDHVPYSSETLSMFQSNVAWAQNQEREFRMFAAAEDQKRLRFKPMPANQRAFLHSLAEDFGFDSESMDPEPHRHVAIFKTPRFVMAPMKTLAECTKIRHNQRLAAAAATAPAVGSTGKMKMSNLMEDPFNGFLVTNPRFALTVEELRAALNTALGPHPPLEFDILFLPNEEVVLKPRTKEWRSPDDRELESMLKGMERAVSKAVSGPGLGKPQLCRIDDSLNVLRRDGDRGAGGWSQVVARAAAPSLAPKQASVGSQSSFSVLGGGKVTLGKKKEKKANKEKASSQQESVVDDWEAAELVEEEKENAAVSGASADESGPERDSGDVLTGISEDKGEATSS